MSLGDLRNKELLMTNKGFPGALVVKNPPANAGDIRNLGLIPGLGRSPGGGQGHLLPVFLPGESHGQRSLAGCGPCGHKESEVTEVTCNSGIVSSSK